MRVPFGSLPDTILETILGAFGVPLGSLGESLWEKRESGKASKKWNEQQECEKIRLSLRGTPFVPINIIPRASECHFEPMLCPRMPL